MPETERAVRPGPLWAVEALASLEHSEGVALPPALASNCLIYLASLAGGAGLCGGGKFR